MYEESHRSRAQTIWPKLGNGLITLLYVYSDHRFIQSQENFDNPQHFPDLGSFGIIVSSVEITPYEPRQHRSNDRSYILCQTYKITYSSSYF